jgi:hypothetical protein
MAIPLPGEGSPLYQTWEMLLHGYGYNFYRQDNQVRADDQLVRQHAAHFLNSAASKVQKLESDYRKRHLPPATREQPLPPADKLATQREVRELSQEILALEGAVRGLSAPPEDKTWMRHRLQLDTLRQLLVHDVQFVGAAKLLDDAASTLNPATPDQSVAVAGLREHIQLVRGLVEQRAQLLLVPLDGLYYRQPDRL